MAIFRVLTKEVQHSRRVYEEHDVPGSTSPLFLGSKYAGESVTLDCVIEGSSFSDAQTLLETTIKALFKANQIITIGPSGNIVTSGITVTGKITGYTYTLKPNNRFQRCQLVLQLGYAGE